MTYWIYTLTGLAFMYIFIHVRLVRFGDCMDMHFGPWRLPCGDPRLLREAYVYITMRIHILAASFLEIANYRDYITPSPAFSLLTSAVVGQGTYILPLDMLCCPMHAAMSRMQEQPNAHTAIHDWRINKFVGDTEVSQPPSCSPILHRTRRCSNVHLRSQLGPAMPHQRLGASTDAVLHVSSRCKSV
ncbi:hypothetical protein EJ02DRAFT_116226 [Clathrospora elynae]|uniref:Uncharacterized protein n=1 Tax=Clathrospora elynae TaxID=706981 RepID=A0A6A5S510_9PLEO|nr:hypothetical protein EJ02DRAFT_116226 [Clathrospora elynae]